jgi:hypothetical protein
VRSAGINGIWLSRFADEEDGLMDFSKVPTWLLAIGVFAAGLAALWVFVIPGKGIEWGGSYYGPYRAAPDLERLKALGASISEIIEDPNRGLCFKFKNNPFSYCVDPSNGNLVSYDARNTPWRGLGKSPQNTDPR